LATPNYGYEKRQRELAKKQKKEEKLRAKADRKTHGDDGPADGPQDDGVQVQTGQSSPPSNSGQS
jgi:hypothetical protein